MGRLDNQRVLITGAGSGIGAGFAHGLALEGATVGIVDLNLDHAEKVASVILEAGGKAIALLADVAERSQVQDAIAKFVNFASMCTDTRSARALRRKAGPVFCKGPAFLWCPECRGCAWSVDLRDL